MRDNNYLYNRLPEYTREVSDIMFDVNSSGEQVRILQEYLKSVDEVTLQSLKEYIAEIVTLQDLNLVRDELLPYFSYLFGYTWEDNISVNIQKNILKNLIQLYKRKGTPYSLYYQLYFHDRDVTIDEPHKYIWILNKRGTLSGKYKLPSEDYYSRGIFTVSTSTKTNIAKDIIESVRPVGTVGLLIRIDHNMSNFNPMCIGWDFLQTDGTLKHVKIPYIGTKFEKFEIGKNHLKTRFGHYHDDNYLRSNLFISSYIPEDMFSYYPGYYGGELSSKKRLYDGAVLYISMFDYVGHTLLKNSSQYDLSEMFPFGMIKELDELPETEKTKYHLITGKRNYLERSEVRWGQTNKFISNNPRTKLNGDKIVPLTPGEKRFLYRGGDWLNCDKSDPEDIYKLLKTREMTYCGKNYFASSVIGYYHCDTTTFKKVEQFIKTKYHHSSFVSGVEEQYEIVNVQPDIGIRIIKK